MRNRKMYVLSVGASLTVILVLGGLGARNWEVSAQPQKAIAVSTAQFATLVNMVCENNCEQKYHACVFGRAINEMNARIEAIPGFKPGKSPREPLPDDFGFGFEEENTPAKKKVNPPPSCETMRKACLSKCLSLARR